MTAREVALPTSGRDGARRAGLAVLLALLSTLPATAQSPRARALPEGERPKDARLGVDPVTLNDYHPFRPVDSEEAWEKRRAEIVRRIRVGSGLLPEPTRTPLNAVVHRRIDQGDYTVEAVFFESFPGHFVTGSLYRPAGPSLEIGLREGRRPGVLCPHGHWTDGRFYNQEIHRGGMAAVNRDLAIGAERFENAARAPLQARCIQLARMGCVVFHYDMIGNADSDQFAEHRRGPRESVSGKAMGEWGFVTTQATARLQTNFGLQTWNSLRAVDFLTGLEEVDDTRLLVTGASGGATQTLILSALDERIDASFPAVMASTAMQGGCTCENTHYLRIGQGNIDIAAAFAPRPLGLTAADDWTIELETKGHPDLTNLYTMLGAKGRYEAHFDIHFKHNYNHVSRTHMYSFANRHFGLGLEEPVLERDFELLGEAELTVWDKAHPKPAGDQVGDAHEKALNRWWAEDSDAQIARLLAPKTKAEHAATRQVLGDGLAVMIGRELPGADEVEFELVGKEGREGFLEMSGLVANKTNDEQLPAAFLFPDGDRWSGQVVIWLSDTGKDGLFSEPGTPIREVAELVAKGAAVVGVDLYMQGEFLPEGESFQGNPVTTYSRGKELPADSWQRSPVYYYGYNHSAFARRVHDVLTTIALVRHHPDWEVKSVALVGGAHAAAARAVAGDAVDRAAILTGHFRFADLDSPWDADFLPGAVKFGDLPGILALNAPYATLLVSRDEELAATLEGVYQAAGEPEKIEVLEAGKPAEIVEFLAR